MPETTADALCKLDGAAPSRVHLAAVGRNEARDGRVFLVDDPDALVATFMRDGVDLPIDYHHQHDKAPAGHAGPIPAAGWITGLFHDAGGLWGHVEWTAQARELIAQRAFRYLSPVIAHLADGRVRRIKGASLVHDPALHLTALASLEADMPDPADDPEAFLAALIDALGLPKGSLPADVLARVETLREGRDDEAGGRRRAREGGEPDPTRYVPIDALREAMRERNRGTATLSEERTAAKVEDAFRRGFITSGMRPWATALCSADEASFDAFLSSTAPAYAHLHRPSGTSALPPATLSAGGTADGDPAAVAICRQLGLAPGRLA